ncbi:MAG: YdcF family protein [Micavibrio aeruginosavorus]|nr:YdcF family protein [Micavibrio aeruginosavorus]
MFFPLSKIVWALLAPANLLFLLLLLAVLLGMKWRSAGQVMLVAAFSFYVVLGVMPVGPDLLYSLERYSARPVPMPEKVDGIIVLGGGVETRASVISGQPEFNDGAERILSGLTLARAYPNAILVFSGGSSKLIDNEHKESESITTLLENIGFPDDNIVYENESRNTYENIRNTKDMVMPQPGETWLMVTSAFHMQRSMAVAKKLGWDVLPYPVDYRSPGRYLLWPERFDLLDNMNQAGLALREVVGTLAYMNTGKI